MHRGQQLARLGRAVLLAAWLSAGGAGADTRFDFEAPGPHQEGGYVAGEGAVLAAGVATLALTSSPPPPWAVPQARYRVGLGVAPDAPRSAYPVRVDLSRAPASLFLRSRGDGGDLRVFDPAGIEWPSWLEGYDWIGGTGALWFRPDSLAGGTNEFLVYYGDPERSGGGDPGTLFRSDPPAGTLWVIDDLSPASTIAVAALDDGTRVVGGGADVTLAAGEIHTIGSGAIAPGDGIATGGPVGAWGLADGSDALAPLAIASATLMGVAPRGSDRFCLAAPFGAASVEIRSGTAAVATVDLAAGETRCVDADVTDGSAATVLADAPVLAYHYATAGAAPYDGYNLLSPATELLGANAGTGWVAALEDATRVDVYLDDGSSSVIRLDAGEAAVLPSAGSQGSGPAVRLVADRPIAAISYADGDGGDAVPFFPAALLGGRFVVPAAAQYALVAADRPGTECVLLAPDGSEADRVRGGTLAPPHPSRIFFGTTGSAAPVAAGSEVRCDGPAWAIAEDGTTQDEKTLWPVQLFRPVQPPEPAVTFGSVGTRFPAGASAVTTPTYRPPWGVRSWLAFEEAGDVDVPFGTSLRYQISVDGGTTWLVPDVGGWRAAADGEAAEPWDLDGAMSYLPAGDGSVAVRALLGSDDGAEAPTLDELIVGIEEVGDPSYLAFGPIASPQRAGRPFVVSLSLVDADGLPVTGYSGVASIESTVGTATPAASGMFSGGTASATVTLDTAASGVQLRARAAGVSGTSNAFDVVAGEAARLEIVSGDGQFGPASETLPEPLRVRVVDAVGNPLAAVVVYFAVLRGGGSVAPERALTDAAGEASSVWTIGAGANLAESTAVGLEDSPVRFAARGDTEGALAATGDGGCGCVAAAGPDLPGTLGPLALALAAATLLRRRGRNGRG